MAEKREDKRAEIAVEDLALSCGFSVNRSGCDETGWDLLVEARTKRDQLAAPFDIEPTLPPFKVQVKALLAKGKRYAAIKLSNWKRHSEEPLPHFIAGLVFENGAPTILFIRHVDQALVERIQKRLFTSEQTRPIYDETLQFTFRAEDEVACNAAAFEAAISSAIGDVATYPMRKLEWAKGAGYTKGRNRVSIVLDSVGNSDYQNMVDFSIGLLEVLTPHSLKVERIRFDRKTKIVGYGQPEATISIDPPCIERVVLNFFADDGSNSISVEGKLYSSRFMLPMLSDDWHKARFVHPFLETVSQGKEFKLTFSMPSEPLLELSKTGPVARIARISNSGPFSFQLCLDDGSIVSEGIGKNVHIPDDKMQDFMLVDDAWYVVERLGFGVNTQVSVEMLSGQRMQFAFVRSGLGGAGIAGLSIQGKFDEGKRVVLVVPTYLGFAQKTALVLIEIDGTVVSSGKGKFVFSKATSQVYKKWIWSTVDSDDEPDWHTCYFARIAELEKAGVCTIGILDEPETSD